MKRMSRGDRNFWVDRHYGKLFQGLTCEVGAWNRGQLLRGLERKLRNERIRNAANIKSP